MLEPRDGVISTGTGEAVSHLPTVIGCVEILYFRYRKRFAIEDDVGEIMILGHILKRAFFSSATSDAESGPFGRLV